MQGSGGMLVSDLYTVVKRDLEQVTLKLTTENHPIFQAHFPSQPILPGFALIDIIAEVLNDRVVYIKHSKFIAHLLPNDIILCKIKTDENRRNIKIFKNTQKVSEIAYESK